MPPIFLQLDGSTCLKQSLSPPRTNHQPTHSNSTIVPSARGPVITGFPCEVLLTKASFGLTETYFEIHLCDWQQNITTRNELGCMSEDHTNDESTMVQVMAWCLQADLDPDSDQVIWCLMEMESLFCHKTEIYHWDTTSLWQVSF